jgi:cyclopropane fatty-acyl-phospholipid synthase-like methyltransferase
MFDGAGAYRGVSDERFRRAAVEAVRTSSSTLSRMRMAVVVVLVILVSLVLVACARKSRPAEPASPSSHEHASHTGHDHGHSHGDHKGGMHHRFQNADQWAKTFDDPARDQWQQPERVLEALALAPSMTVVDVGAGTGYFAVKLARAVPKGTVIATDLEADMVRHMTERAKREGLANLRAQTTPADDPQLAAGTIDRILVVDVWHHLADRRAYAAKLAAALKPGGLVAVVDFKLDATRGPPAQFRLAADAIAADFAAAGLATSVSAIDLPDQYIVIAKR